MAAKAVVSEIACRVNTLPFHASTLFSRSVKPVRCRCYYSQSKNERAPNFGLFFDIDGVIVRGKHILPGAREAFKLLTDKNGKFWVPSVFLTNAGNTLRQYKAKKLSEWLGIQIDPKQVVMSHSPLQMFRQYMDKHVLVSGQGPTLQIAKGLGFTNISTIDDLRQAFPKLDMVDECRHAALRPFEEKYFPKIDVVLLLGEPVRWETNLQIIIDVLVTNGRPSEAPSVIPFPHIPVLACNMDLLWMAEAPMPRFGHGCFLICLESLYYKITGYPLKYTTLIGKPSELTYHHSENILQDEAHKLGLPGVKRIYAIGDNPETDIYGANLFNRYLCKKHATALTQKKRVNRQGQDVGEDTDNNNNEKQENIDSDLCSSSLWSEQCESILVCTGVYNHSDRHVAKPPLLDHNHRDFIMDPQLKQPSTTVGDVLEAVQDVFRREGISTL